jgi:hypothetical protein
MGRPIQHGAGHAEIVVLSRQAFIDDAALAHFRLKRFQLRPSAPRLRSIRKVDSARLQSAVEGFQQMGPANVIEENTASTDRPPLDLHAGAVATNMQPDHARAKGLEQLLAVAGVVTQIGKDQSISLVAGINLRAHWRDRYRRAPAAVQ